LFDIKFFGRAADQEFYFFGTEERESVATADMIETAFERLELFGDRGIEDVFDVTADILYLVLEM
jgi:hypothetical protein